ncbi:MAG: MFS transporter, partial [Spirochaetia bacterium]|nr:MFS transporter [Spirochaetia bacterium]
LWTTFAEIRKNRPVFWFLAAYFFYIDGVDTVISMATSYGTDLGLKTPQLLLIVLVIQIVAFPCAVIYGYLAKRVGPRAMLFTGIAVYLTIVSLASILFRIHDPGLRLALYWLLAMLVATSQGGIQALSRSVFGKLIPADRSAGYFGFYNIFGRFAAIVGPTLMALTARFTGDTGLGVLSLAILFVIGGIFLSKVRLEHPAR